MNLLRHLALLITLAAVAVRPAVAAGEQTAEEAAQQLFALTFGGAMAQLNAQAVETVWPDMAAALTAKNPSLDAATLAGLRHEFERIRLAHLHELMRDVPSIYLRHLTVQEMRDLIVFYRTPTGSKLLAVLPKIMTEAFATVLPRMPTLAADAQEAFVKLLRERGYLK